MRLIISYSIVNLFTFFKIKTLLKNIYLLDANNFLYIINFNLFLFILIDFLQENLLVYCNVFIQN